MKYLKLYSLVGLLTASLVNASRSDFYGKEDNRPKLFKILDDHVGTIKINLDEEVWKTMKKKTILQPFNAQSKGEKYGTNNATMEFFVKGTDNRVKLGPGSFVFQLGGKGSRNFSKPGYNIKMTNDLLYDVKVLRLRSNIRDNSVMREKLSSDMMYKMGIPTTSTNYVNVEVNGEDLGLYILTNKINKQFIKRYFGDADTANLYECKNVRTRFEDNRVGKYCNNSKDELVDDRDDIMAFSNAVNNAKSIKDLEKIIDVDKMLRSLAYEFITVSWDHFLGYSHNYFWYKRNDGKWMMLHNDFDETWGQDYAPFLFLLYNDYADKSYIPSQDILNVPNISIRDLELDHKIMKYLVYDDDTHFRRVIGEIVKEVFNPKVLFPRIDEIGELIRDDVANSRTYDKNGHAKGCFNVLGLDPKWNITHWKDGINFGNWNSNRSVTTSYGLKFFIQERFRYLCHTYGIDPNTFELIEPRPKVSYWGIKNKYKASFVGKEFLYDEFVKFDYPNLEKEDYMQKSYNANPEHHDKPTNYKLPEFRYVLGNKFRPKSILNLIGQFFDLNKLGTYTGPARKMMEHYIGSIDYYLESLGLKK